MLPLKSIAFLIYFFGISAASLVMPILGIVNYMMIYQVYPEHAWWHIPLEPLGIRYSMTAAVCMMLGMLVTLPRLPACRPALNLWDLSALGMAMVVVTSEFTGLGPSDESAPLLDKFFKMVLFIFCMTRIVISRRHFSFVVWTFVLGSLYIGYDAWTAPPSAFAMGRLEKIGGPDFRQTSGLAAHMSMMLPIIGVAFMTCRSWLLKPIVLISGALTINTIVLSRTRSAFVGLLCGVVAVVLLAPKGRRLKTYAATSAVALCSWFLIDQPYWDRMATLKSQKTIQQDDAASARLQIWEDGWRMIRQYPLGVGVGNFIPTIARMDRELGRRAPHNSFLLCWAELGIQGIVLFTALLGTSLVQAWQCHRRAHQSTDPAWTRYMAYGLMVSLVISAGTQFFTDRFYTEAFWWLMALPGCLKRVVIREAAEGRVPLNDGRSADIGAWWNDNPLAVGRSARGALA